MRMLRLEFRTFALMLAALMIVVAGCGGEDAPQAPSEPKVTEEPAAAEPAEEPAAEPEAEPAPMEEETPEPVAESAAGGLIGKVTFDGPRPEQQVIDTKMDAKCAILHGGEPIYDESKVVSEDGGVQNAFVYIKNPPEGDYPILRANPQSWTRLVASTSRTSSACVQVKR